VLRSVEIRDGHGYGYELNTYNKNKQKAVHILQSTQIGTGIALCTSVTVFVGINKSSQHRNKLPCLVFIEQEATNGWNIISHPQNYKNSVATLIII